MECKFYNKEKPGQYEEKNKGVWNVIQWEDFEKKIGEQNSQRRSNNTSRRGKETMQIFVCRRLRLIG